MKKRILSLLCALCLMFTMLPTTAFAAWAVPTLKVEAVRDGDQIKTTVKIGPHTDMGAINFTLNYDSSKLTLSGSPAGQNFLSGAIIGSVTPGKITPTWHDINATSSATEIPILTATFDIVAGQSGPAVFTIDSISITDKSGDEENTSPGAGSVTTTTVTIPKAPITSVSATVSQPVKGYPLDTSVNVYGATAYTADVMWKNDSVTVTGDAQADTVYTALITLKAKEGEAFASSLNNTTTSSGYSIEWLNSAELLLTKEFDRTNLKETTGITIVNTPLTVAVPTAEPNTEQKAELPLTAKVNYDDGTDETVDVSWSFVTNPQPECVNIEAGSKLTVTNKATDGTVEVKAAFNGMTATETVTITKEESKATHINATPPATTNIAVPNGGTNTSGNCSYKVYDQYGAAMTEIGATWKMKLEPATVTGVTLIPANGSISVTNAATTCKATLHAESGALKSNEITFNIIRETSKVTSVRVNAPEYIMNVPKVTEPGTLNQAYQQFEAAKVLDQYGQEMTGQTVTWNVANDAGNSVTGVSIDNNGLLTVTNEAPAITVYVTATCLGIESNKSKVTINKEPAKATLVEICDQVGEAPETSLIIPTGTGTKDVDYTAKVYDQYGVYMPTEMVHWALDPATVPGVELDDTSIPGSATLKVDSTATSGTTFKLKATTATLGTTGVKELNITLTNKTPASVTAVPAAKTDLFYNGTDQALVTAGTASGGTMQYSLDGTTWSPDVPTGKDVGDYTVKYKVVGDDTHTDTAPQTCQMVMISPKFLTKNDLTPTGSTSKVYDGTTNSSITVGVKEGVLYGSDTLPITGTAVYNSADVNEANTITFTPAAITTGNYRLADTQVLTITDAKITPRDLIVTPNGGQSKKFGAEDPTLHSTTSGKISGQIPDYTGALSRAEGENVGQYDITLGTLALIDQFSSGFKASNYTLKLSSTPVKFEITKADAPALEDITLSQKYTVTAEQSKAIGTAGMPADAGTLTYAKGTTESTTGTVAIDSWAVDATGKVTYTLSGGAAGDTVTLPVTIGSDNYENSTVNVVITLTKPSSSGGGGGGGVTTYPITVKSAKNGDVTASHKSAAKGTTITLTVDPDKGYVLDTLTVLDGKDKDLKLTEKNGKFTFTMPASKVTVAATFKAAAPTGKNPFIDVPAGSYYEDAVIWAVDKGITTGTGATTFNPNGICTRAQAVTFLWRAAGSPAAKSGAMPFADVKAGSYYYDAVLWAVEQGITKGTSDTMFSPDATCTRAQIVTFLWRANGSPAVSGNSAFTDVAADAYYAAAVTWAEKNDITGGIGGGLFGSNNNCTRAQIVTFIYRSVK